MARQDDYLTRKRFDGVLDASELAAARKAGYELVYCPLQQGWVLLGAEEDGDLASPLSWHVGRLSLFKQVPGRPVHPKPESLALRVWVEDDLPAFRALMSDPTLWTFMLENRPERLDDDTCRALIALSTESPHHRVRVATLAGQPVGQVRLEYGAEPGTGELSYWLGAPARGQGIGRQMVARFLDRLASQQPEIRRITARVHPENRASVRLLEACGFAPCDRSSLGLAARGRDDGSWLGFLRPSG